MCCGGSSCGTCVWSQMTQSVVVESANLQWPTIQGSAVAGIQAEGGWANMPWLVRGSPTNMAQRKAPHTKTQTARCPWRSGFRHRAGVNKPRLVRGNPASRTRCKAPHTTAHAARCPRRPGSWQRAGSTSTAANSKPVKTQTQTRKTLCCRSSKNARPDSVLILS